MMRSWLNIGWCLSLILLTACVEEYELPVTAKGEGLLVVDGSLYVEAGTAEVKLTRSQRLESKGAAKGEVGATVWIEHGTNNKISLVERAPGLYKAAGLNVVYGTEYRLRIKTKAGLEYMSTQMAATPTPPIDAITWGVEGDLVNIRVSTHDPTSKTRYYRWEFEETFAYAAPYVTANILGADGKMRLRTPDDSVYQLCYRYTPSSAILVGASSKLAEDVVNNFRLTSINGNSEKLALRYSMLVRQYAISQAEFDFWQILRKNTEEVGSLFDSQPSQVRGNITNRNAPADPVLGFFSVKSMATKRFFLDKTQLQPYAFKFTPDCFFQEIPLIDGALDQNFINDFIALRYVQVDRRDPIDNLPSEGIAWMVRYGCVDCRDAGGTGKKPSFW